MPFVFSCLHSIADNNTCPYFSADVFKDDDFQKGITTLDSLVEVYIISEFSMQTQFIHNMNISYPLSQFPFFSSSLNIYSLVINEWKVNSFTLQALSKDAKCGLSFG